MDATARSSSSRPSSKLRPGPAMARPCSIRRRDHTFSPSSTTDPMRRGTLFLLLSLLVPASADAQHPARARDLGIVTGTLSTGAAERDHRRRRRAGRPDHGAPGRLRPDRHHRHPAPPRQRLPRSRPRGHPCRQRIRQAARRDPGRGAGRARDADPAHLHPLRVEGGRRDGRVAAGAAWHGRRAVDQSGGRRDQRRLCAQRHPEPAHHRARRAGGARGRAQRRGRGRERGRGDRDGGVRLEGRDRHVVAPRHRRRQHLDRWRARAVELRRRPARPRCAGRARARPRRRAARPGTRRAPRDPS